MTDSPVYFRETQRFRQPWLWAILIFVSLILFWAALAEAESVFQRVLFGALGLVFLLFFAVLGLRTEVREDGIHLKFFPLHLSERHISANELTGFDAREYRPLAEYGGWGIRRGRNGWAYNVRGTAGVELRYRGKTLLVGTQQPREFIEALDRLGR
ncbi:hypothetical protein [Haladaptatus sp. ZSTT2]|uniref:hypothetical protein n=1 Tax=Haladaptatus sp. ZSTT2 TaxID=3120515 RepID=UPI00300F490D